MSNRAIAIEALFEGLPDTFEDTKQAVLEMAKDADRLDWIEKQYPGDVKCLGWQARKSITGRGFRLHHTQDTWPGETAPQPTAREAIDAAMHVAENQ